MRVVRPPRAAWKFGLRAVVSVAMWNGTTARRRWTPAVSLLVVLLAGLFAYVVLADGEGDRAHEPAQWVERSQVASPEPSLSTRPLSASSESERWSPSHHVDAGGFAASSPPRALHALTRQDAGAAGASPPNSVPVAQVARISPERRLRTTEILLRFVDRQLVVLREDLARAREEGAAEEQLRRLESNIERIAAQRPVLARRAEELRQELGIVERESE